jgi:hypothetical protein
MKFAPKVLLVAAAMFCSAYGADTAVAQETCPDTGLTITGDDGLVTCVLKGTFTADNDVLEIPFVVGATSDIVIRSYSYAGGENAAGETIDRGGFDPTVSLFTSLGGFLAVNFDDTTGVVGVDLPTAESYDVLLAQRLVAGNYIAVITQFDKTPSNQRGPTFTSAFGCTQGFFCDFLGEGVPGSNRTAEWAIDISGIREGDAVPSPIPLPASAVLLGSALAAGGAFRGLSRRKAKRQAP